MRDKKVAWEGRQRDFAALGWRRRRGHDLRRTFISLARADGARPDVLKLITHGHAGDMISIYTEMPWEALCEQVVSLRVSRLEGRVVQLLTVPIPVASSTSLTTGLLPVPLSDEDFSDPTGIRTGSNQDSLKASAAVSRRYGAARRGSRGRSG